MNFFTLLFNQKPSQKRGFSLIELLVVLGIFIVITALVLARQNRFSSDILLTDLAYQVAISIRQAQVYGLGVRDAGNLNYDTGYGIHFDTLPASSYVFFPDLNKDGIANVKDGKLESALSTPGTIRYDLARGQKITGVCGTTSSGKTCLGTNGITAFNVIYDRPDPSAHVSDGNGNATYNDLIITLISSTGDRFKCVTAYKTGQVSVSNPKGTLPNPCI